MNILVLEKLEGGELFEQISHQTFFTEEQAKGIIRTTLLALKTLHSNHIVHRYGYVKV